MPVIIHHRICGGATAQQKGRASELRTYLNDWDVPAGTITDPDAATLRFRLNKIVHSGDKNPYQNHMGNVETNIFANDPNPPHTQHWGRKNLFDERADRLIKKAEHWEDRFNRMSHQPKQAAVVANISKAAQSLNDKIAHKKRVKEEQEAAAKAAAEEAIRIAFEESEEGKAAAAKKEKKKKALAAEKEQKRLEREAEEEAKAKAKRDAEEEAKAKAKQDAEDKRKAADQKRIEQEAAAKARQEEEAEKKKAAPPAKKKEAQPQPQPATKKDKKKGASAAASADEDLDALLNEAVAAAAKEKAELEKKSVKEDEPTTYESFIQTKDAAIAKINRMQFSARVLAGVTIWDAMHPNNVRMLCSNYHTIEEINDLGHRHIEEFGLQKCIALEREVGRIFCDLNQSTKPDEKAPTKKRLLTDKEKAHFFPQVFRGNWESGLIPNGWTDAQLTSLPTTLALVDGYIIPIAWALMEDDIFVNGKKADGVEVYPYIIDQVPKKSK
jgi:hypothetical protein